MREYGTSVTGIFVLCHYKLINTQNNVKVKCILPSVSHISNVQRQ